MASTLLAEGQEARMKIDPSMIIGAVVPEAARPAAGSRAAFEDVLKGLEGETAARTGKVPGQFQQMSISPQKITALSASEEALDLLDRYSRSVSDPLTTLKGFAPLVDEMESMKARLDGAASFLSDDDPLKGIMTEVSSVLYGEVLRFRRGDLSG